MSSKLSTMKTTTASSHSTILEHMDPDLNDTLHFTYTNICSVKTGTVQKALNTN